MQDKPNALATLDSWSIDTQSLNKESLEILNKVIAEQDPAKSKDLTYLFNLNQNKKTMARVNKLNDLQDALVDQTAKRVIEKPDEISNTELITALKTVQDMIERGQKQVAGINDQPLIQINQQTNEVNIGTENLNKESRERVKNAVLGLLNGLKQSPPQDTINIEVDDGN